MTERINMEQWVTDLIRLTDEDDRVKTEKQLRIIQAAVDIFSEKGYASTSTSEIAQKAGVAEGTIFRHYKTKKDLLFSIVGPVAAKLVAPFLMRDFAKVLDLPYNGYDEFMRAVALDRLRFARKNVKLLKILLHEIPFQPELKGHIHQAFTEEIAKRMEKVIRRFQEEAQLIEAPPWRILRSSVSMVFGMVVTHTMLLPDFAIDDEEEINHTIDILMYGISRRLPPD